MDALYEIVREDEGRVGHAALDNHHCSADPANPYRVERERKRIGHSMVDGQLKHADPHTDPAMPESRLGQKRVDTQWGIAEAATNSDPAISGCESGHASSGIHSSDAALANDPASAGVGEAIQALLPQSSSASPAKVRKPRGSRCAVGQSSMETHAGNAGSAHISEIGSDAEGESGQAGLETHITGAALVTQIPDNGEGGVDHRDGEVLRRPVDLATITAIRHHWRKRQAWHRAEKALTLQAKALCRGLTDGDKGEADNLYKAALGKGEHKDAAIALGFIMPLVEARDSIENHRKAVEKHLVKLAKTLHVAPWVESVRGVGIASLAGIIGEAGDLSVYANPGKLWKRMGVAPHQGRAYATWRSRGGLTGADWVDAGYSPVRRSVLWNVGACVMKAGGPLKEIYDARKVMELVKCEAIAADPEQRKLFAKDGRYAPKLHAHNRAQRYVEKRFLLLLWKEWRRPDVP